MTLEKHSYDNKAADNNVCSICLEEFPDTCAPCGFTKSRFHLSCIERLREFQGETFRCPHCNQTIASMKNSSVGGDILGGSGGGGYWTEEIGALDKLNELLLCWLLIPKNWIKKSTFVRIQNGMQRGEKERRVLRCVVASVVSQLKAVIQPIGGIRVLTSSNNTCNADACSKKTFICRNGVSEFSIVLRRVAFIETRGRISSDGYSLSGHRRRLNTLKL